MWHHISWGNFIVDMIVHISQGIGIPIYIVKCRHPSYVFNTFWVGSQGDHTKIAPMESHFVSHFHTYCSTHIPRQWSHFSRHIWETFSCIGFCLDMSSAQVVSITPLFFPLDFVHLMSSLSSWCYFLS